MKEGSSAPPGRDEGCAAPSEAKAGCAALLGPPCCHRRAISRSDAMRKNVMDERKLLPCERSNFPFRFVLPGFAVLCLALICSALFLCLCFKLMHTEFDSTRRLLAFEPGCASLVSSPVSQDVNASKHRLPLANSTGRTRLLGTALMDAGCSALLAAAEAKAGFASGGALLALTPR